MANYFVKVGGNDANNGTTWALAKATVQAGMNLCTTAGDRPVVAPGTYYENSITPPSAGTRGTNKVLIGDFTSTIADGGSNTSGVAAGYIKIDASLQSGNKGASAVPGLTASNNWAYWDLIGLWVTGGSFGVTLNPSPPSTPANDGVLIEDCIFEGNHDSGLTVAGWTIDSDTYSPITLNRVVVRVHSSYTTPPTSMCAFFPQAYKGTAFPTNPQFIVKRSDIGGTFCGMKIAGANSNLYTYVKLINSNLWAWTRNAYNLSYAVAGDNATYSKLDDDDCVMTAYGAVNSGVTVGTSNRRSTYLWGASNVSTLSSAPLLPPMHYLWPGSVLKDVASTVGVYPDLFGTAALVGGDDDVGAQEFVANRYPKEPTMIPGGHDFPIPGNVTEDDTTDGTAGTYHEATVAEVQSGVTFGAASALTGTYAGGGGRPEIRGGNL